MHCRARIQSAVSSLLIASLFPCASAVAGGTDFNVSASSFSDYTIDGFNDPILSLQRGQAYNFLLDVTGHPFLIKTVRSTGNGNTFNNGVTNNGAQSGVLTFVVPLDAPDQLFYNCGLHGAMGNTINITAAPAVFTNGFEGL